MPAGFRLVRLGNTIVSFVGTIVGGVAARGAGVDLSTSLWAALVLAAFSTAFVTAGGNVINDLLDRESDRVNHPDRPLVTGAISPRVAQWTAVGLLVGAVAVAVPVILVRPLVGVFLFAALAALLSYEFRFKSAGFGGNLLVAFLTGLVFLYGGAATGVPIAVLPFAFMAFFATLSREVIKDMEDLAGDVHRRTLPRVHGIAFASVVARGSVGTAVALSVLPFLGLLPAGSVAGIMYAGLVLVADALFVLSVLWLPARLHAEQSVSKGAMAVALLAFLAVAFR
ncbi:MAG TPA: geranylgeranylglycerol-phosphate geranylgeranyltransferase [Thermoplasmata archaeon]|nr:geranylgeranylglycerol-phosphate geranylgeranyltransferase [Thermoplasmata archaeon]